MIWILIGIGFLFIEAIILHDAIRDQGQDKRDTQHERRESPVAIPALEGEQSQQEQHRTAERHHWAHERIHNRRVTIFSAIAAIAAIVAAIVATFAYIETRRQADAALEQTKISLDTEKRSLRAYISILSAAIQPQNYPNGSTVVVQITIKNSGQTPAYDERSFISVAVAPANANPFTFWPNLDDRPRHILGPNVESTLDNAISISATDLQEVMNGTKKIFVWGRVEYQDVFGQSRYMIFRDINGAWYGPPSNRWAAQAHPLGEEAN